MLIRDTHDNMYHIVVSETRKKRVRTYHTLCGRNFAYVPHGFESADYYTRCEVCKRIMLARTGKPVERTEQTQMDMDDG